MVLIPAFNRALRGRMPARSPQPRRIFRTLLAGFGLLALLLLSGCGVSEQALVGIWRGQSADTAYTFELNRHGKGRLKVTTAGRKMDYACDWSLDGDWLWLRRAPGTTASFRIMEQSGDEMVLRVANGLGGVCRLQRVALR
jgi:hypothetical protein